jgi:2-amino-4-hydroxy-6-hydroxymethyldihydropteridine diphosphokinase
MNHYFLGLGSNLHKPKLQIEKCLFKFNQHCGIKLIASSTCYHTKPLANDTHVPSYQNLICLISTHLQPIQLMDITQFLERAHGRRPKKAWGEPRALDIDLIHSTGHPSYDSSQLKLPHPGLAKRDFVLAGLVELDRTLRINKQLMSDLLRQCVNPCIINRSGLKRSYI